MPLIDLKTNLKDLKYGHDQRDGVSSNQPFVPTLIPANEDPLANNYLPKGIFPSFEASGFINLKKDNLANTAITVGAGAIGGALVGGLVGAPAIGALVGSAAAGAVGIGSTFSNQDIEAGLKVTTSGFQPVPASSGTGGPDFLVRGGLLLPTIVSKDAARMSRFLSSQNGLFFVLKQQLLSRVSTRPEYAGQGIGGLLNDSVYNPLSTVLGAVGAPFGLHTNKQGLNPLAGIFKEYTPDRYYSYITNDNNEIKNDPSETLRNRLYSLYNLKLLNGKPNKFTRRNDVSGDSNFIISYQGGPGSVLGIGRTRIKYATDQYDSTLSVRQAINPYGTTLHYNNLFVASENTHVQNSSLTGTTVVDFRKLLRQNGQIPDVPPYEQNRVEKRVNLGDPGNPNGKVLASYYAGFANDIDISYGAASPNSYDKITALPIYRTTPDSTEYNLYSDLVDFRIGVIDNTSGDIDNVHFRAFLNSINDNYDANWNTIKYIGRGENFYTYSGFDRKISLSWTVAAQSKIELIPMYKKLNYLASLTAPDYGAYGYMRANIIQLTIGGYLFNQPGLINKISYEISEDTTWEIGIDNDFSDSTNEAFTDGYVRQLPHMIKVNFEFTPIHNFVPRKQQNSYGDSSTNNLGQVTTYGNEQFIALADSDGNLYNDPNVSTEVDKKLYSFNGLPLKNDPYTTSDATAEANAIALGRQANQATISSIMQFTPGTDDGGGGPPPEIPLHVETKPTPPITTQDVFIDSGLGPLNEGVGPLESRIGF